MRKDRKENVRVVAGIIINSDVPFKPKELYDSQGLVFSYKTFLRSVFVLEKLGCLKIKKQGFGRAKGIYIVVTEKNEGELIKVLGN